MSTIQTAPSGPPILISYDSIRTLLKNKASATHICVFIVIAAHRQFGTSSARCGYDAISKCVGIGFEKAKRIVSELLAYQNNGSTLMTATPSRYEHWVQCVLDCPAIYDRAEENGAQKQLEYLERNKQEFQKRKKREVRWQGVGLNVFKTIWVQRSFIGKKLSKIKHPIYHLNRRKNDIAARLLMIMYAWNDLELDGVIWSTPCIMKECFSRFGSGVYFGIRFDLEPDENAIRWVHGLDELPGKHDTARLWKQITDALEMLEDEKFIKKVVVVDVWDTKRKSRQCCYDLHKKGERLAGSLRQRITNIAANNLGHLNTRADGRSHDGNYYAVAPEGSHVELSMIYRLSHVAWVGDCKRVPATREGYQAQASEWLNKHEIDIDEINN